MNKYKITVVETLEKVYYVEAESLEEAEDELDAKFEVNEDDMSYESADSYNRRYVTERVEGE